MRRLGILKNTTRRLSGGNQIDTVKAQMDALRSGQGTLDSLRQLRETKQNINIATTGYKKSYDSLGRMLGLGSEGMSALTVLFGKKASDEEIKKARESLGIKDEDKTKGSSITKQEFKKAINGLIKQNIRIQDVLFSKIDASLKNETRTLKNPLSKALDLLSGIMSKVELIEKATSPRTIVLNTKGGKEKYQLDPLGPPGKNVLKLNEVGKAIDIASKEEQQKVFMKAAYYSKPEPGLMKPSLSGLDLLKSEKGITESDVVKENHVTETYSPKKDILIIKNTLKNIDKNVLKILGEEEEGELIKTLGSVLGGLGGLIGGLLMSGGTIGVMSSVLKKLFPRAGKLNKGIGTGEFNKGAGAKNKGSRKFNKQGKVSVVSKGTNSLTKATEEAAMKEGGKFAKLASRLSPRIMKVLKGSQKMLGFLKRIPGFGLIVGAVDLFLRIEEINSQLEMGMITEKEHKKMLVTAVGSVIGGNVVASTAIGVVLGSEVPIIGNLVGGLIVGSVGYFAGEWIGAKIAEALYDFFVDDKTGSEKPTAIPAKPLPTGSQPPLEPTAKASSGGLETISATPQQLKGVAESGTGQQAMKFFMDKGWSKEQAAGIVGNLMAESGTSLKTNAGGDNGESYGLAQWHKDRRAMFNKIYGKDMTQAGFDEQLEFVNWELNNTEKRAGAALRGATTAADAAAIVDKYYERSAGLHTQKRMDFAQKLMEGNGTQTASTAPGVGPTAAAAAGTDPSNPLNMARPVPAPMAVSGDKINTAVNQVDDVRNATVSQQAPSVKTSSPTQSLSPSGAKNAPSSSAVAKAAPRNVDDAFNRALAMDFNHPSTFTTLVRI